MFAIQFSKLRMYSVPRALPPPSQVASYSGPRNRTEHSGLIRAAGATSAPPASVRRRHRAGAAAVRPTVGSRPRRGQCARRGRSPERRMTFALASEGSDTVSVVSQSDHSGQTLLHVFGFVKRNLEKNVGCLLNGPDRLRHGLDVSPHDLDVCADVLDGFRGRFGVAVKPI